MHHRIQNFQLVAHDTDCSLYAVFVELVFLEVRVCTQCCKQTKLDTDKIHNETAVLTGIRAVYARYCLYDGMALRDRLVDVNRVKERYIEAGEP